jgi:CRISPR-associated DxTHG motif protein
MGITGDEPEMKVISFLGLTNYSLTTFCLEDQCYETRLFPAAVAHFVKPDKLLICATPAVQEHENLTELRDELARMGTECNVIPIPDGHSEDDLWRIFDSMTAAVDEGESVIFDVTHSFRSLPILAFLAVAYLKAAKQVQVERVLYGAYEARDEQNCSPVFDLTPFVSLLDWLAATNRFIETGDGHALAGLLKSGMPSGRQMGSDLEARALGQNLRSASEAIDSISLSLRVTRPIETMQSAAQLEATLTQAMPGILNRARPFAVLAEQVAEEYGQFALENPSDEESLSECLWRQLEMLEWYLGHRHVVQATTLGREWVVSTLAYKFEAPMFDYIHGRKLIEQALNNAVEMRKSQPHLRGSSPYDKNIGDLPQIDQICKLWSKLTGLRNDIAHVGMRPSPKSASLLKQNIESLFPWFESLAHDLLPHKKHNEHP